MDSACFGCSQAATLLDASPSRAKVTRFLPIVLSDGIGICYIPYAMARLQSSAHPLNDHQKTVRESWEALLWEFAKREWKSAFLATSLGIVAAESVHLLLWDISFQSFLSSRYKPQPAVSFDDPRYYYPYIALILLTAVVAIVANIGGYFGRGLRSWWAGVTSGLIWLTFWTCFLLSLATSSILPHRLILGVVIISSFFWLSFRLFLRARVHAERTIKDDDFRVPASVRSLAGSQLSETDEPIQSWAEDALGRAELVDSLSVKIMIAKAPVILLSGHFGSGKTSTLNLLREHLEKTTIIVSFSSWLPGSQETLTSYLLADIANECKKHFVVPGLRQSTRRVATALGDKVPFLSDFLKVLPTETQRDQIENLKSALLRLPKRVVVLLDEIDRMDKEELVTLLKVIRGISKLPNLSFVCAGDRMEIIKIVKEKFSDENNAFFEKFFPVLITVPDPHPTAIRKAGIARLKTVFALRGWFKDESEKAAFEKRISELWDARVAPFCQTPRAIGLLANDVSVAAAPLRMEVDPIDLTLVEMLHRFAPLVYELIAKNQVTLTGGESLLRGGSLRSDEDLGPARTKFLGELRKAVPEDDDYERTKEVLDELFPLLSKADRSWARRARLTGMDELKEDESKKRIRQPGIFPAYFRYEVPEAIFSSVQLAEVLETFEKASSQASRDDAFRTILSSMEKGSLKRDDFLRKIADSVVSMSDPLARSLAEAALKAAERYTYDSAFRMFAEAGHVLRLVFKVAQKLKQSERIQFLRECILNATDDSMAFNIFNILPLQKDDGNLNVREADLYQSFITRMRKRFGRNVDANTIDLSTGDPWAFDTWGRPKVEEISADPEDRKIQYDFWRRYIGKSRARLAEAFRAFFLPVAVYPPNPESVVENKIPIEDLRTLYRELPDDPALTTQAQKSLETLKRLLDGEFKDGLGPMSNLYGD
jgi:predicted KAP-like P-loop ATPase